MRNKDRVQLYRAEVVGRNRQRRDERRTAVVAVALHPEQGAAEPPALAELELVAHAGDLGPAAAGIPVHASLDELDAALRLAHRVVEAEPEVKLIAEPALARAMPVEVVREPVDLQVEIESAALGGCGAC